MESQSIFGIVGISVATASFVFGGISIAHSIRDLQESVKADMAAQDLEDHERTQQATDKREYADDKYDSSSDAQDQATAAFVLTLFTSVGGYM